MSQDNTPVNSSRRRFPPVKGLLGAVLIIAYWLLAPVINQQLGTSLPELGNSEVRKRATQVSDQNDPTAGVATSPSRQANAPSDSSPAGTAKSATTPARTSGDSANDAKDRAKNNDRSSQLRYGILREVQPDRFLSPAGLMYGPGSQEGHRLKHLERHTRDAPSRPGKHGVFEGDMPVVLQLIDEAYAMARVGDPNVSKDEQGDRAVYTIDMERTIGFVGGREGNARGKPPAEQLRLVLEGNQVITAFPL